MSLVVTVMVPQFPHLHHVRDGTVIQQARRVCVTQAGAAACALCPRALLCKMGSEKKACLALVPGQWQLFCVLALSTPPTQP